MNVSSFPCVTSAIHADLLSLLAVVGRSLARSCRGRPTDYFCRCSVVPDSMSTDFQPLTRGARHDLGGLRFGRYEPQDRVGSVGGDVNHDGGRIAAFQLRGADVELVAI